MKKTGAALLLLVSIFMSACSNEAADLVEVTTAATTSTAAEVTTKDDAAESTYLTGAEKRSIKVGELSPECEYYAEVEDFAENITEISIYDEEIDDTFIIHISLPPNYNEKEKYPLVLMTDGVWRLSDHPEVNRYMTSGEIEEIILCSIGYPNGYDYIEIRQRDFLTNPDKFLHFISDNLVPYLNDNYSIDLENSMLAGHSYGGFFTYYALFNSDTICKNYFHNFYIGSASIQASWGGKGITAFEQEFFERANTLNANVYATCGSEENELFKSINEDVVKKTSDRGYEGISIFYEEISGTDHNTVFKPSLHNALIRFYGKAE